MKLHYEASKMRRQNRYFCWGSLRDFEYGSDDKCIRLYLDLPNKIIFDSEEHGKLLYNAKPCIYTDRRFKLDYSNHLIHGHTTKAILRKIKKFKNISNHVATFTLVNNYYLPSKKNKGMSFKITAKVEPYTETIDFSMDNNPDVSILKDSKAADLAIALLKEGFYVEINSGDSDCGNGDYVDMESGACTVMAYGYGKKIGFSEFRHSLWGYVDGEENILYDWFGEFDKWSRCIGVSKNLTVEEIVSELKSAKLEPTNS